MISDRHLLQLQIWALSKRFLGGRAWYQYFDFGGGIDNSRFAGVQAEERTASFTNWLSHSGLLSRSDTVLDLGSNAGAISLALAPQVKHVYGLEIDRRFHRQAIFLQSYLSKQGNLPANVTLMNEDVLDNLQLLSEVDVIIASKFLYHRDFNHGINKFMSRVNSSKVRLIIIQGHTIYDDFGTEEDVTRHMQDFGFQYKSENAGTADYPIGIAYRFQ